jgi:hypothetical protein
MDHQKRFKIIRQCFDKKVKARGKKQRADEEQKNLILFHSTLAVLEEMMRGMHDYIADEPEDATPRHSLTAIGFHHPDPTPAV